MDAKKKRGDPFLKRRVWLTCKSCCFCQESIVNSRDPPFYSLIPLLKNGIIKKPSSLIVVAFLSTEHRVLNTLRDLVDFA